MKSGMLAAEEIYGALTAQSDKSVSDGEEASSFESIEPASYQTALEGSWVWSELHKVRNVHPSFHWGLFAGLLYSGLTLKIFKGIEPWTFSFASKGDHTQTGKASDYSPIDYPKPDGKLTFDILSNLQRSGVNHNHDQPAHLKVKEDLKEWAEKTSYEVYAAPETRFCPARVYEFVAPADGEKPKLVINAQNCVHCKTCDIKTPGNYIKWTVPEGSGGPQYVGM
jgi:electron-transferring-flavoprotein dehydrogenase